MSNLSVLEIEESNRPEAVATVETSRELKPVETNTDQVALRTIEQTTQPHPSNRIDRAITPPPVESEKVNEIVIERIIIEPNPAYEGVKAALLHEKRSIQQLQGTEEETNKHLELIDQLLDLSTELVPLADKDKTELSEKTQLILKSLKEKGIDLLKGDPKEITKEQLIELKSVIGSHIDKSRTKVQQIFTKMQNIIQNMTSVNDTAKRYVNLFMQLLQTITRNMRPH